MRPGRLAALPAALLLAALAWGSACPAAGPVRRVVALTPSAAETVCALGREHLLAGVVAFSDHPESLRRLPRVGSYARPDLERILALRPDLCLAVSGMTPEDLIRRLERLGVGVLVLKAGSLQELLDSVEAVGRALGAADEARLLAGDMRARLDAAAARPGSAPRPAVLYQIGASPLYAACAGTFIDELITLAGGRNVCAHMRGYPRLTMEQAVLMRPEVILLPAMGTDQFEEARARWAAWPDIPAVRHGRLHRLDSDLFDRPGPRTPQGAEELARLLGGTAGGSAERRP